MGKYWLYTALRRVPSLIVMASGAGLVVLTLLFSFRTLGDVEQGRSPVLRGSTVLVRHAMDSLSSTDALKRRSVSFQRAKESTPQVELQEKPNINRQVDQENEFSTDSSLNGHDETHRDGGRHLKKKQIVDGRMKEDVQQSAYSLQPSAHLLRSIHNPHKNPLPLMLVTGERPFACKTPEGSHLLMKSYKNKVDYCSLQGCTVWYVLESWEEGFTGTWARYPALLRLMKSNPSIEWFMWMDADAIFTDLNFSIPLEAYNKDGKNLILPGYWDKVYGDKPDWLGANAGIFLLRNCEWSHSFIRRWQLLGTPGTQMAVKKDFNAEMDRPLEWDPDDQSALIYLLRTTKDTTAHKVHLETGYVLHGYWDFIVDKFEKMVRQGREGEDGWPFVTHFCGCNFCGSDAITERCLRSFERAFHFADNQLLARVGLGHANLSTSRVMESRSR